MSITRILTINNNTRRLHLHFLNSTYRDTKCLPLRNELLRKLSSYNKPNNTKASQKNGTPNKPNLPFDSNQTMKKIINIDLNSRNFNPILGYVLVVVFAALLLKSEEDFGLPFVSSRMNKDWFHVIESISELQKKVSLIVYPGKGFFLDFDGIRNSNIFVPISNTLNIEKLIDLMIKKAGCLYEDISVVYRVPIDVNFYEFISLAVTFFIFVLQKSFFGVRGGGSMMKPNMVAPTQTAKLLSESFGESKMVKKTGVRFEDVLGCEEAKMEIKEFVTYMKQSADFKKLNARIPTGAILYGPPGTGKTLLAKALADECGTKFFSCAGSDFVQMFVGIGASRVRSLFEAARKHKPAVVFIDEIDAVATDRSVSNYSFSEKESTLNQLLSEMDGFKDNEDIIVIAGTNKFEYLDKAILRPGRFDRHIYVGTPDVDGRKELYKHYLKPIKIDGVIPKYAEKLSNDTPGFTGASIANHCNEAAIIAVREKASTVNLNHFEKAADRIRIGANSGKEMSKEDKHVVAVHEAGHVIAGWFMSSVSTLQKVTIVPRGRALGFAQYHPQDINFMSTQQIYEQMVLACGGRVAEEIIFNEISTSARDDIERITDMAYQIVAVYGMDPDIKSVAFSSMVSHNVGFFGEKREFSKDLGDRIDEKVSALVQKAYNEASSIINANKDKLLEISGLLENVETIQKAEVESILGPKEAYNHEKDMLFSGVKLTKQFNTGA